MQGSIYYNSTRIQESTASIQALVNEMDAFRTNHPDLWRSIYDGMYEELQSILSLIEFNPVAADKQYNELILSKYDNLIYHLHRPEHKDKQINSF